MTLTSFQRKILYLVLMLPLFIILFQVGKPPKSRVDAVGVENTDAGGLLARMRDEMGLAEAKIGQIDPSSTTMKLATFGMRGVAVSILWHRVNEFEKREDWNNLIATGNQLVLLEPHFTKIWEFLGWKIAYNASASFDDYRERYRWVIRGFDFLTEGLKYNRLAPKLCKNAGWTISQKIGIADENEQYRRLLREDDEFGKRYNCTLPADRDNWMLGRRWYKDGEDLVKRGYSIGNESDFLFFSHARLNLFNYAMWVRKDGIFGAPAKQAWINAGKEWDNFAKMDLSTAIPNKDDPEKKPYRTTLARYDEIEAKKKTLTDELHAIVPNLFETLCLKRWEMLGETPGQQASLLPYLNQEDPDAEFVAVRKHLQANEPGWQKRLEEERDKLYTEQQLELKKKPLLLHDETEQGIINKGNEQLGEIAIRSQRILSVTVQVLSQEIQDIAELPREKKARARSIIQEYDSYAVDQQKSDLYRGILNFNYRNKEVLVEQTDEVDEARRLRHFGRVAYYDNRRAECNRLWLESMDKWNDLLNKTGFEYVKDDSQFVRDILEMVEKYVIVLDADNELFPPTFGLQDLVRRDFRKNGSYDNAIEAQEFARKTLESGHNEEAFAYLTKIIGAWSGMNELKEYMKLAPLPEVRDTMLAGLGLYVQSLQRLNKPLADDTPLLSYAELMLKYDPAPGEARKLAGQGRALLAAGKPDEAESELLRSVEAWKKVLDRYPLIALRPQLPERTEMLAAAQLYAQALGAQKKEVPKNILPFE